MAPSSNIDISENTLRHRGAILDILLLDRTRSTASRPYNIIWATDSYEKKYGKEYGAKRQIKREQITGMKGKIIQPRAAKSKEEQKYRTKDKAEVFTPLKIVKEMNAAIDGASKNWPVVQDNWLNYISEKRLEMTCGEGPFIASRYNPVNGKYRETHRRVGFLDAKLKVVGEYVNSKADWLKYAEIALKSSYGYEWQGDNLLIARENILLTLDDFYKDFCSNKLRLKSKQNLTDEQLEHFAEIISWNIFQMDGINYVIPMTRVMEKRKIVEDGTGMFNAEMLGEEKREYTLEVKKQGRKVKIMDWVAGKPIRFADLIKSDRK